MKTVYLNKTFTIIFGLRRFERFKMKNINFSQKKKLQTTKRSGQKKNIP